MNEKKNKQIRIFCIIHFSIILIYLSKCTIARYSDVCNVHRMFITYTWTIGIPKNEKKKTS